MAGRLQVGVGFRGAKALSYADAMSRLKPRPTKLIEGLEFWCGCKSQRLHPQNQWVRHPPKLTSGRVYLD